MSSESPAAELYSSDGYELAIVNNATIPVGSRGILVEGTDGVKAHFVKTDGYGNQLATLTDGYNGIVAVKPANTIATAADPALVVTLSPNSQAQANATGSGTITALNGTVVATASGYGSVIWDLTGTWVATITVQATNGDGSWINVASLSNQSGLITNTTTINGTLEMNASGWTQARLIATAFTSGTVNVTWSSGQGNHVMIAYQGNGINLQTNTALVDSSQNPLGVTPASTAATATQEALVVALSPNTPVPTGTNTIGAVNQGTAASLANAWSMKITDATNGPAAVKPASTAAVATDSALVVTMSPNSTASVTMDDVTATGALGALNAAVQVVTAGLETVGFQLAAGTLIGTIIPEVSFDGGTTWNATYFDTANGGKVATIVFASANTATAATIVGVGGSGISRVRVSAYTSGTANITLRSTTRTDPSALFANPPGSTTAPPDMAYVGGSVTTAAPTYTTATINALSLDTTGNLRVTSTNSDVTATGNLNALNAAVTIAAPGHTTTGFQLAAGTLIGTIVAEASYDGGTTWNATYFDQTAGNKVSSVVFASANTALGSTIVGVGGAGEYRIRVSAFTSGTAAITLRSSTASDPSTLTGGTAASALPPLITQIGGSVTTAAPTYSNATLNALSLTTAGALRVDGSGAHIKGTVQPLYGSSGQAMTITMTALTTANTARASTAVDNTSVLYEDVLLFFSVTISATGTISTNAYFNFYGYGSVDNGTTYPEGISGTDGNATLTSPPNLVLVAQMNTPAVNKTYTFGPVSFCRLYGCDRLPAKWGIVAVNQAILGGNTATITAGSIKYQGVNGQLV